MSFVKLDSGILDSSLWPDVDARGVFLTALAKAEPFELSEPAAGLEVRSLDASGVVVEPGWYGLVKMAGPGLVRLACVADAEAGLEALERLASPDPFSRTPAYEGRRLIRIDGGWIVVNYDKYRQKDTTAAERKRRHRERLRQERAAEAREAAVRECHGASRVTPRDGCDGTAAVTQEEVEVEGEAEVDTITPSAFVPEAPPAAAGPSSPCCAGTGQGENSADGGLEPQRAQRRSGTATPVSAPIHAAAGGGKPGPALRGSGGAGAMQSPKDLGAAVGGSRASSAADRNVREPDVGPSSPSATPGQGDGEGVRWGWNAVAKECGLTYCRKLGQRRSAAVRARLRDPDWAGHYGEALSRLRGIRWVRGANERGWVADFDWFIRPETVNRILEGAYDDNRRAIGETHDDDPDYKPF